MRKQKKKIIVTILMVAVLLCGCGEGSKRPGGISDDACEKAISAIEITDSYIKENAELEDTISKLYGIEIDTETLFDTDYILSLDRDDKGDLIDENLEYPSDIAIEAYILDIQMQISTLRFDSGEDYKRKTLDNIEKIRDSLADKINYKD